VITNCLNIKTGAVVTHCHGQPGVLEIEADSSLAGFRMLADIIQGFLGKNIAPRRGQIKVSKALPQRGISSNHQTRTPAPGPKNTRTATRQHTVSSLVVSSGFFESDHNSNVKSGIR